jgi:hypothetical protein
MGLELDPEVERRVEAHLDPDEQAVWVGRPDPNRLFWLPDIVLVPVGAVMLVFTIAGFFGVLYGSPDSEGVDRGPNAGSIVGSILFLIGFGTVAYFIVFGRVQLRRAIKRRTYYGLTEHRAIVVYDGRWIHRVREQLLSESELDIRRRRDGSGTITLHPLHGPRNTGAAADPLLLMTSQSGSVAFCDLQDVDTAAAKIRELRSGRRS